jgi:hypothetical protein
MTNKVADKTRAHRELIINEHIEAEAVRHDVAATIKTFKHPRHEVPALRAVADGAEAVNGFLQVFLTAFPDFYVASAAESSTRWSTLSSWWQERSSPLCWVSSRLSPGRTTRHWSSLSRMPRASMLMAAQCVSVLQAIIVGSSHQRRS